MRLFSIKLLFQVIWLAVNLVCIIIFLANQDAILNGELRTLLFLQITALSAPFGYIVGVMADYLINSQLEFEYWASIFLIMTSGFVQWFIFLPWIFKKYKARNSD